MKRTHNNLTENKFRAIEKGDPGEGGGGAAPPPPPPPQPPPPSTSLSPHHFLEQKSFFGVKSENKIFTCEEHVIHWFIY